MISVLTLVAAAWLPQHIENFVVNGVTRRAIVCTPSKPSKNPPIVFGFHGHGGNMQGTATYFNIQGSWPEAIVVYPQGLNTPSRLDPQGTKPGWQPWQGEDGDRDLKLFDVMYKQLSQEYSFDKKRVYSVGFSNGSIFSYVLWSQRLKKVAAVALAAGVLFDQNKPLKPLPAFLMAGQQDNTAHFPELLKAIKYVKIVDGVPLSAPQPTVGVVKKYNGSHADVLVYIHSGGHLYPTTMTPKVVTFFKHHPQS